MVVPGRIRAKQADYAIQGATGIYQFPCRVSISACAPAALGTLAAVRYNKPIMFFSIDGGDGAGKSTQIALLGQWLREMGHEVVACRDPGSTPLGEAVRRILLDRHDLHIHRRSEMLLYMAARRK